MSFPEKAPKGSLATLQALVPYLWPQEAPQLRVRVVAAMVLLLLAKVANIYVPILYKKAVDALQIQGSPMLLVPLGLILAYGAARILAGAFSELRDAVFARVGQHAIRTVGLQVFRHLHNLSLRFHLNRKTGGLSRSIERGTKGIQTLLSYMLFTILPTLFELIAVVVLLGHLFDWRFAAITFVTVVLYLTYTLMITEWRNQFRRQMNDRDTEANSKAIDSLLNYETVKYFSNEAFEAQRYDLALRGYEQAAVKSQVSLSLLNIGQATIISVGLTLIMWLAAQGISQHQLTLGDFVLVNTYLLMLYDPLSYFGFVYREIKLALVDMEQMFTLLHVEREVSDVVNAPDLQLHGAAVTFQAVSFAYDARRPILQNISLHIPAGHTLAVVGASGSGKSTLSRLLFRFYDVADGAILIDGQDIRQISQLSLRHSIGMVPQDTVLFNESIRYNIAYGKPNASQADIEHAARLARIHDFISAMPDGYDTLVGERGLKLSGGEKQRVAIARTLLKQPAIFIFDEATSALDTQTEREIQANLREVSQGRTTLIIAHRLSTIVDADEIIVMEQGQILERGTHLHLLSTQGRYAEMWARQQEHGSEASPAHSP